MSSKNNDVLTLGVDIGGTKIDTALVDSSGNIITSYYRLVHPDKEPDQAIEDVIDSVNICLKESGKTASALGIGVAGQIDKVNGCVRHSPNLPEWHDVPLKARLEEALNIPVSVNNVVRVSPGVMAAWRRKGSRPRMLFVGPGIGGGIVSNGAMRKAAITCRELAILP
jgi:glucokinase